MLLTSAIGRSGSKDCMTAAMLLLICSGIPVVRTDMVTDGQGLCAKGTSISGNPSRLVPPLRTFSYTPTICQSIGGPIFVTPGINCSTERRCVNGSTLGKYGFTY